VCEAVRHGGVKTLSHTFITPSKHTSQKEDACLSSQGFGELR